MNIGTNASVDVVHVTLAANQTGAGGAGAGGQGGRSGSGGMMWGTGSAVSLKNTVVAANEPIQCIVSGTPATGALDVIFGPGLCTLNPKSVADPLLGPLADNGGPTRTMGLGEGSPAIDLVPVDSDCPAIDQRGISRPQRDACDAGAFELQPPAPPPAGPGPTTTGEQPPPGGGDGPAPALDATPPTVVLHLTKQRLPKALRKGFVCSFTTNEPGSAAATLGSVARGGLAIKAAGTHRLRATFTKRARKRLRARRRVRLKLILTVTDSAGNMTRKTAKVTLKR
jgi:hypothetical protein